MTYVSLQVAEGAETFTSVLGEDEGIRRRARVRREVKRGLRTERGNLIGTAGEVPCHAWVRTDVVELRLLAVPEKGVVSDAIQKPGVAEAGTGEPRP